MKKAGVVMVVASYVLLLFLAWMARVYAREDGYRIPAMFAEPSQVTLTFTLAIASIMLALVPLRRGERWAGWTMIAMWPPVFLTRFVTDPRCWAVLNPHQHGCHSYMIASLLNIVGLALAMR
jgi:phosphatidylglycerophosphate synthase